MLVEAPLRSVRDRLLLLRSWSALGTLEDGALTLLAEHARNRRFRAGEELIAQGRPNEFVYLIVEGRVSVSRKGAPLLTVEPGGGVGFIVLLARDPEGVRAVAQVDTRTLEIPALVMFDAYEHYFSMVRNGVRLLAQGLLDRRGDLPASPEDPPSGDPGTRDDRAQTLVERLILARQTPFLASANLDAVIELVRQR